MAGMGTRIRGESLSVGAELLHTDSLGVNAVRSVRQLSDPGVLTKDRPRRQLPALFWVFFRAASGRSASGSAKMSFFAGAQGVEKGWGNSGAGWEGAGER